MQFSEPIALVGLTRSYVGKLGGSYARTAPADLMAQCFQATLNDAGGALNNAGGALNNAGGAWVGEAAIAEVVVGNVRNSIGNIGRVAALSAGVPESVPAITVDRQCASGLEALSIAACKLFCGMGNVMLVGGVESASLCPWLFARTNRPYDYAPPRPFDVQIAPASTGNLSMGETAEVLADGYSITREQMDNFACESHRKAAAAQDAGYFRNEVAPGEMLTGDEGIRANTSQERLAKLRPVFRSDGRVTAGNSSQLSDGAASCLVMRASFAAQMKIEPDALVYGADTVGLDPNRMGLGPALSIPRLLQAAGLEIDDIDLFEINEAFAAQMLAALAHLKADSQIELPPEKLNVFGGAIALGHPFGATGLRLLSTLVNALKIKGKKRGIASLCIGGGQGMSVLLEV